MATKSSIESHNQRVARELAEHARKQAERLARPKTDEEKAALRRAYEMMYGGDE